MLPDRLLVPGPYGAGIIKHAVMDTVFQYCFLQVCGGILHYVPDQLKRPEFYIEMTEADITAVQGCGNTGPVADQAVRDADDSVCFEDDIKIEGSVLSADQIREQNIVPDQKIPQEKFVPGDHISEDQ
jgi:hypothetical protein